MKPNGTKKVTLEVRDSAAIDEDWTDVNGSNDETYSYQYSGGDRANGKGKVRYLVGNGQGVIKLRLRPNQDPAEDPHPADDPTPRYVLMDDCISFVDDPHGQLSSHGEAPHNRVIHDRCTRQLDAQYKVLVTDTVCSPHVTIQCDPRVVNDFPPK